jgi:hypothetical protein
VWTQINLLYALFSMWSNDQRPKLEAFMPDLRAAETDNQPATFDDWVRALLPLAGR